MSPENDIHRMDMSLATNELGQNNHPTNQKIAHGTWQQEHVVKVNNEGSENQIIAIVSDP